jgi:hypothetical protein
VSLPLSRVQARVDGKTTGKGKMINRYMMNTIKTTGKLFLVVFARPQPDLPIGY